MKLWGIIVEGNQPESGEDLNCNPHPQKSGSFCPVVLGFGFF